MEQNLWLAAHRFSFWYWKLGGTVKKSTPFNAVSLLFVFRLSISMGCHFSTDNLEVINPILMIFKPILNDWSGKSLTCAKFSTQAAKAAGARAMRSEEELAELTKLAQQLEEELDRLQLPSIFWRLFWPLGFRNFPSQDKGGAGSDNPSAGWEGRLCYQIHSFRIFNLEVDLNLDSS